MFFYTIKTVFPKSEPVWYYSFIKKIIKWIICKIKIYLFNFHKIIFFSKFIEKRLAFSFYLCYNNVRCLLSNNNVAITLFALLAQLDRVFGYEPKGQGFESLTARHMKRASNLNFMYSDLKPFYFAKILIHVTLRRFFICEWNCTLKSKNAQMKSEKENFFNSNYQCPEHNCWKRWHVFDDFIFGF